MTLPRRFLSGQTWAASRRTSERRFFLVPHEAVNEIVAFALAAALEAAPTVALHAFVVLSTHFHAVLTDLSAPGDRSQVDLFFETLDGLIAKGVNAHLGRGDHFWTSGSWRGFELHDQAALEQQLVYLYTNPIKDGLTPTLEEWPGVRFLPEDFGEVFDFAKPESAFFGGRRPADFLPTYPPARRECERELQRSAKERKKAEIARLVAEEGLTKTQAKAAYREAERTKREREEARAAKRAAQAQALSAADSSEELEQPPTASFVLRPPPVLPGGVLAPGTEAAKVHYRRLLDQETARLQAKRAAEGKSFLGVEAVLSQDPFASSGSTKPTYESIPRALAADRKLNDDLQAGFWRWQDAYRQALRAWPDGQLEFPPGTQVMVTRHGARRMSYAQAARQGLVPATGPPSAA